MGITDIITHLGHLHSILQQLLPGSHMAVRMDPVAAVALPALAAVVLHQVAVVAAVGVHLEPLHQADQSEMQSSGFSSL
jgi:hypothetical protein